MIRSARAIHPTLALGAVALGLSGCAGPSLSSLSADWPIRPAPRGAPGPTLVEVGGGPGGALITNRGASAVTPGGTRALAHFDHLDGARLADDRLYRIVDGEVVRSPAFASSLWGPVTDVVVARLDGAHELAVGQGDGPDDDVLLVAGADEVLVVHGAETRVLWHGEAVALAVDGPRRAAWILGRAPAPVLDRVDLVDASVRLRVALPERLAGPDARVLASGEDALVVADGAPLGIGVLVSPAAGVVAPLDGRPGLAIDATADPPLCAVQEAPSPPPAPGRAAALGEGRFLLVSEGADRTLGLAVVSAPARARSGVVRRAIQTPDRWCGRVEAVGWDDDGALLAAGPERLLVDADGCRLRGHPWHVGDGVRHLANVVLTTPVVLVQYAAAFTINVGISCAVLPVAPFALVVSPGVGLAMLTGPVWFPPMATLGAFH